MKGIGAIECPKCGGDVPDGAVSCPTCGTYVDWNRSGRSQACWRCGSAVSSRQRVCPTCGVPLHENQTLPAVGPMDLGDIFSATFRLVGRLIGRYLLVALLLFVPVSVLFVYGMHSFYSFIGEAARSSGTPSIAAFIRIFLIFGSALFLLFLVSTVVKISITAMAWEELKGIRLSWHESVRMGLGKRLLRVLGQMILISLAMAGLLLIPMVLLSLGHGTTVMLLLVVFLLAAAMCVVYVTIRWSFAFPVIVCEDSRIIDSLRRSWLLVEGEWWRVFGILLLFGILTGFAITIVTTPVTLVAMWDFYAEYFKTFASHGGSPDPEVAFQMLPSMGRGIGVSIALNLILSTIVTQIYVAVLYGDLRARRGELPAPEATVLPFSPETTPPRS